MYSEPADLCGDCGWLRGNVLPFCGRCAHQPLPGDRDRPKLTAQQLLELREQLHQRKRPAAAPKPFDPAAHDDGICDPAPGGGTRYAIAALKYELETMAGAPDGVRNDQLNESTYAVARFIRDGLLDRDTTVAALTAAAEHAWSKGKPAERGEIEKTIRSALNARGVA